MSDRRTCRWCHESFMTIHDIDCCGKSPCFEQEHWTDEEWSCWRELALRRSELDRRIVYVGMNDQGDPVYKTGHLPPGDLDLLALAREP